MNRKRAVDIVIMSMLIAALLITGIYGEQIKGSIYLMWGTGAAAFVFFLLALKDNELSGWSVGRERMDLPTDVKIIKETVLLSEEDTELMVWDMYGKTAMVIGRDEKENHVDIDLSQSPYAGMVDVEHAVLNFSAGQWFAEDLGSRNGLNIKKSDGKLYKLSTGIPCRMERGDCLYVGQNRLLFR